MNFPSPIRLLLLDDDDLSRELLTLLLTDDGFAVTALPSGDAALDHLASTGSAASLDAVLTDLQMPGLSGPSLAHALRDRLPSVPILAMSGSTPPTDTLRPFAGFLLKPFTSRDLRQALTKAHQSSQLTPAPPSIPQAGSVPVLEDKTFRDLAALMQPAQLHDLLALCLAEVSRYERAMAAALEMKNRTAFRAAAHTLKGSVAMIGARELQDIASTLEAGDLDPANQAATLAEIPPAAERLRRMLLSRGVDLS